jgi:hypothetical protein
MNMPALKMPKNAVTTSNMATSKTRWLELTADGDRRETRLCFAWQRHQAHLIRLHGFRTFSPNHENGFVAAAKLFRQL